MTYDVKFNATRNQVEILTPKCLIDHASLRVPTKIPKQDNSAEKFRVRAMFKATLAMNFYKTVAETCRMLLDESLGQYHPLFAPHGTPSKEIAFDFLKRGCDLIAEKKHADRRKKEGDKMAYSPALDYLQPLLYFYASTLPQFPPALIDAYGKPLNVASDDYFKPSFIGRLKIIVKRNSSFGSKEGDVEGGQLTAYLQGVQFIQLTPEINYMREAVSFEADDGSEVMFEVPKVEIVDPFGVVTEEEAPPLRRVTANANSINAVKIERQTIRKPIESDDISKFAESYE